MAARLRTCVSAKIVCTLGPRPPARTGCAPWSTRGWMSPDQPQPRQPRPARGDPLPDPAGGHGYRPWGGCPRRPAGPQDPPRSVRVGPVLLEPDTMFVITTRKSRATRTAARPRTEARGRRASRRPHPGRRRAGRPRRDGRGGPRVTTLVVEGGMVSTNKGINLPGTDVSVPAPARTWMTCGGPCGTRWT